MPTVFSHAVVSLAIATTTRSLDSIRRLGPAGALCAATASHGVLDAMTDGGLGVAFLAPFDDARYFLPWRPIPVSPISASRFLSEHGLAIMQAEVLLIWLPAAILLLVLLGFRLRGGQG